MPIRDAFIIASHYIINIPCKAAVLQSYIIHVYCAKTLNEDKLMLFIVGYP